VGLIIIRVLQRQKTENQIVVYCQQDGYREMGAANCHLAYDEEIIFTAVEV
jgi:hypothetical protein